MRLLPDTNVLIYDTVEDSEHHEEAARIIDEAGEVIIPSIVIHEYIWAMFKIAQVSPSFLVIKLREYLGDPKAVYVFESAEVLVSALKMLEADGESLREMNDYIILATALHYNLKLATFDRKLRIRALERGLGVVP
ncbi:MAG: PIN domain-containing protein [Candidatus Korarchaeum sp.]